jgi:hypothetical protein
VKPRNKSDAGKDEESSHEERADNAPKQDLVLARTRNFEVTEDDQKDEKVINAEREFDDITGDELQHCGMSMPPVDQDRKSRSHCDPHDTPPQSLLELDGVTPAMEHAQVERQHDGHEQIEQYPKSELIQSAPAISSLG